MPWGKMYGNCEWGNSGENFGEKLIFKLELQIY
jgi:hypothetical protein